MGSPLHASSSNAKEQAGEENDIQAISPSLHVHRKECFLPLAISESLCAVGFRLGCIQRQTRQLLACVVPLYVGGSGGGGTVGAQRGEKYRS